MTSEPHPAISVILPIRNRKMGAFTLKFLQGQLSAADELVISFNNSSPEVIDAVSAQAKLVGANLKILQWDRTIQIYAHWKLIIKAASNDHILFVHDDDVYHGRIVDLVRRTFASDPDASFVTSQMVNINLSKKVEIRSDGDNTHPLKYSWTTYFEEKQHNDFTLQFNTSFYAFRLSKLGNIDFLEKNPPSSDFLLFFAALLRGNIYVLPEFLATRLQHGANDVHNELYRANHSNDALEGIFKQAGLEHTQNARVFLEHARMNAIRCYRFVWKLGTTSGADPRKLLIVYRRLRKLAPESNHSGKYTHLRIMMFLRPTRYWKLQNWFYLKAITIYRAIRGPSAFYRKFPELTIAEFSASVDQPENLVEEYIKHAYRELGIKR